MARATEPAIDGELLRLLVEDAGLGVLALDRQGAVSAYGPGAASLFLLPAAELRGQPLSGLLAPDARDEANQLLEQARHGRVRKEAQLRRRDGTLFPAQLFLAARQGESGAQGFLLVIRDLGEEQEGESDLLRLRSRERAASAEAERQRDRLHGLLADAPALIALTRGPEHVAVFASSQVCKLVPDRQIIGRRLRDLAPQLAGQGILEAGDGVFRSGRPFSARELRVKLLLRPGRPEREGWFDFLCRPTRDSDGRIDGLLFFGIDVTKQVQARQKVEAAAQALLAQQDWFEAVLDLMPTPLMLIDPSDGGITFANRSALEAAGGGFRGQARGAQKRGSLLTDGQGRALRDDEFPGARAARGERVEGVQLDAHLPDGSVRSLLFHAALLPAMHGHPASVVMPFLDVTRLKRVEGQLQSAVAARDEFLSIASHELRTPLTALQLELQALQKRLGRGETMTSEQLSHRLETGVRQVNRLGTLVNSLLDISRLTAGRIDLQIAEVDLAEVAREVTARLAKEAARAGCSLGFTAGEGPVTGQWDRLRLEQIVSNLISNAIKYGGGRPVEVAVEHDGTRARLRVSDGGIGIAPEDQARIFDRFERAVSERHYGGFGLGLWIVRQIVHALQGGIWVQSRVGEGATFIVELPRERRAPTPPPPVVEAR
jgi:PAS domain S-box-containing protein